MKRRNLLRACAWAAVAAVLPVAWLAGGRLPPVQRYGRHYVVNGWIVTSRDLEALRRHVA